MKKYGGVLKQIQKNRTVLQAALFNVACIIFYQIICEVHFGAEEDQLLNHIFSGAHGENASALRVG